MPHMNRRESMFRIGTSLGSVAFASLLAGDAGATEAVGPLAPNQCTFQQRQRIVFF